MIFHDISQDTQALYRLDENEQVVFFILNRTGEITFELIGPGAAAHIFAIYSGSGISKQSLHLIQKHLAPDTTSSALVKAALAGKASFSYDGAIVITRDAHRSDASQESRALLLSPEARVQARPALEILAHDVKCHHAATTAPLNEETLYFVRSRGLSRPEAEKLLVQGFFQEALERMKTLNIDTSLLREKILSSTSLSFARMRD
jgi:Fe-S cluster assembly protein SufD